MVNLVRSHRMSRPGAGGTSRRTSAGFTLVELMIGLVLMSILSSMGLPLYRTFILNQRLQGIGSDLRIAMVTARSEAVKRNRVVQIVPDAAGWGTGWSIPDPVDGTVDLLNHQQTGLEIAIAGPLAVGFSPAGRALTAEEFEIVAGPEATGAVTCLQLQIDGRTKSVEGVCP
jgi:prepilin-type N-terminal cleavage/methylation domain-containing protein